MVLLLNVQNIVLVNNSITTWPTQNVNISFSDNLFQTVSINYKKNIDGLETTQNMLNFSLGYSSLLIMCSVQRNKGTR